MIQMEKATHRRQKGISGWLSPEGEFIFIDYGEHAKTAINLEIKGVVKPIRDTESGKFIHGERLLELSGYIKFVCRWYIGNIIESYVFFPQQFDYRKDITKEQIEWIETNRDDMTALQEISVSDYIYQEA